MNFKCIVFLWLAIFVSITSTAKEIYVLQAASSTDASYSYYTELLKLALRPFYPVSIIAIDDEEKARNGWHRLLNEGTIDVVWAGASAEREKLALPVRIPLLKGLLGYRSFIINKHKHKQFQLINRKSLSSLLACQKDTWPDSDILEANHFKLARISSYELMFKLVDKNRCDYFPRAIFETPQEVLRAKQRYSNLAIYEDTILYYPFPMYFFVGKHNKTLAKQLQQGLILANQSGQLDALLKSHIATKSVFPLSKWHNKTIIRLTNPTLSPQTPLSDSKLWLKLGNNA